MSENVSFDISAVINHFERSSYEKDDIHLISYVQAYEELSKLHRALAFLIQFVQKLVNAKEEDNVSIIFRTSYQETLANHHTWLIRQSVSIASRMVPNRQRLIEEIFANHTQDPTPENIEVISTRFLEVVNDVYNRVQTLYEEKNLLNLP
uniref:Glycolipid transfer protein domain-containing protein n=1 Tax=Acrobeloides nanus TaxID=290746 RepID=A0A914CQ52_9BILA